MPFRRRVAIPLLLIVTALAALQVYAVRRAHALMGELTRQLVPRGELRYARLWPQLWGSAEIWGLSFQPEGLLRVGMGLPPGYRLRADHLWLRRLQLSADGGLVAAEGAIDGLQLPMVAPPGADAVNAPLDRIWPLWALGYPQLRLDLDFSLRYVAEADLLLVQINAAGPELGRMSASALLEGRPGVLARAQDQIRLRRLDADLHEAPLLARYRQVAAQRTGLSQAQWRQRAQAALDRAAAQKGWAWDAQTVDLLRDLIAGAGSLHLRLDPGCDLLLRDLRLFPVARWPTRLGLQLLPPAPAPPPALQARPVWDRWIDAWDRRPP